ncbi:leucine-rich repeat domain-containing protein [Gimesia aquarii]|uniref:Internalin-A n=1 Tax=Gimesia aquarii TaxID=2527964 RepID=A0A517VS20_9PLAN|nr:hypothetical protein [Gimesia aquarii]QDT95739.1 Internalin-A precursor [Gimesia aquarii]
MILSLLFAGIKEIEKPSRYWFNLRKLFVVLSLAAVFILIPFVMEQWRSRNLVKTIRSHGGQVQFGHGNCIYGICSIPHPKLAEFTGAIGSISIANSEDYPVNDAFIDSLGKQPHLYGLTLGNKENPTQLTDRGLAALTKYPLIQLGVTGGSITDAGCNVLGNLTTLKTLMLHDLSFTGEQFDCAPKLKNLNFLYLSDVKITDSGMENLASLPGLSYFDIDNTQFERDALRHLSKLKKLSSLRLRNSKIEPDTLKHLAGLKTLNYLTLKGKWVNDEHVRQLANLTQLKVLSLNSTQVADQGLIPLLNMKSLDSLSLTNSHITDEGLRHLTRLESLSRLGLSYTQISDQSKEFLLKIPKLVEVSVYNTKLSAATIQSLRDSGINVFTEKTPDISD